MVWDTLHAQLISLFFFYDLLFHSFVLLRDISTIILCLYIGGNKYKVWWKPPHLFIHILQMLQSIWRKYIQNL